MKLYLPFNGKVKLTSPFGYRNLNGTGEFHGGVDLVGMDDTRVIAPCDGVVGSSAIVTNKSDLTWQWGNYIRLDTDDGKQIFMCHLASRAVERGERVKRGQTLGIMGNTGYSFGAHTHFEVRIGGAAVDPTRYLGIANVGGIYENEAPENIDEIPEKEAVTVDNIKKGRSIPAEWAKDAVEWMTENELMYGDENGNLMLDEPVTREQMCVFLYRLNEKTAGK